MKRRVGLLAYDLSARAINVADERKVGGLYEAPFRARTQALSFRDDGFGADGITTDDVNAQFGAVAGVGSGKGGDYV